MLATRLLNQMGVWSVLTFLVLYLRFVVGLGQREANHVMVVLTATGAVLAIGASFASARLIHRHGVVRTVQASSWVMALTAASYALIAVAPRLALVAPWCWCSLSRTGYSGRPTGRSRWRCCPAAKTPARTSVSGTSVWVLPQVVGPVTTGVLITVAKRGVSAPFAYAMAFGVAAVWFVAASVFIGKLRLRRDS